MTVRPFLGRHEPAVALLRAFGVEEKGVYGMDLRMRVDEPVELVVYRYADAENIADIKRVTEQYLMRATDRVVVDSEPVLSGEEVTGIDDDVRKYLK